MNNEREIDLVDLIFFVLEKWRLYILVGCIGLVLFGAYKFIRSEMDRAENEALIAEGREDEVINSKDYQAALDALDSKKRDIRALEEKITQKRVEITDFQNLISADKDSITTYQESLNLLANEKNEVARKLAELQEYMKQSILLRIDATAKPVAKRSYQVIYSGEGAETLFRDPVDEILAAYTQNVSLIGAGSGLSEKYNTPDRFFEEAFSVSYDATSNMIFVQAYGVDEQMAKDVLNCVCKIIEGRTQGMSSRYHGHELKVVSEDYREVVDENLASSQSTRFNMVNSYNSQIADYDAKILNVNTAIDSANASIAANEQQIKDANDSIGEVQADIRKVQRSIIENKLESRVTAKAPSRMRSLKDGTKFGIIGGIVLAILTAVMFCAIYVFDGKLHTASEISTCYQLPLLAVLNRPFSKKGCFIDRWIYKMRNKTYAISNEEIMKTGAVVLAKLVGEQKRVAILSSLEEKEWDSITASLTDYISNVQFVFVANSNMSVEALEKLKTVDAVIIYEKRDISYIRKIDAELQQAKLLEKSVIGGVVG